MFTSTLPPTTCSGIDFEPGFYVWKLASPYISLHAKNLKCNRPEKSSRQQSRWKATLQNSLKTACFEPAQDPVPSGPWRFLNAIEMQLNCTSFTQKCESHIWRAETPILKPFGIGQNRPSAFVAGDSECAQAPSASAPCIWPVWSAVNPGCTKASKHS